MSHALNTIWVHVVWTTKYRNPLIEASIENVLHEFLRVKFQENDCLVNIVNGMPDHIHALIALPRTKTISDIMQSVKGASSRYINEQALTPSFFAWQTGFGVISVSPKDVKRIHQYILNQKNHHRDNDLEFEP